MLRFVVRHGLVRFAGRRALPALLAYDLLVLANRTRRIPLVDRNLRRGAGAARERLIVAAALRPRDIHLGRPHRPASIHLRRPGVRRPPEA